MGLSREAFEELVAEAIDEIPEPFATLMRNVYVIVEDEPSREQLAALPPGETLFGLYQGIPQTDRGPGYTFVQPDRITIFRGPILRACDDAEDVQDEVLTTIVHEVAHHFGISDERLDELGW